MSGRETGQARKYLELHLPDHLPEREPEFDPDAEWKAEEQRFRDALRGRRAPTSSARRATFFRLIR